MIVENREGGFDMDLIATKAPTQLLFYSRLQTNGTAGVDVLKRNVSNIPGYFSTAVLSESSVGAHK